jgi:hypothetical protein
MATSTNMMPKYSSVDRADSMAAMLDLVLVHVVGLIAARYDCND